MNLDLVLGFAPDDNAPPGWQEAAPDIFTPDSSVTGGKTSSLEAELQLRMVHNVDQHFSGSARFPHVPDDGTPARGAFLSPDAHYYSNRRRLCTSNYRQCDDDDCCDDDFHCYERDSNYKECRRDCPRPDDVDFGHGDEVWDCYNSAGKTLSFMVLLLIVSGLVCGTVACLCRVQDKSRTLTPGPPSIATNGSPLGSPRASSPQAVRSSSVATRESPVHNAMRALD